MWRTDYHHPRLGGAKPWSALFSNQDRRREVDLSGGMSSHRADGCPYPRLGGAAPWMHLSFCIFHDAPFSGSLSGIFHDAPFSGSLDASFMMPRFPAACLALFLRD